MTSVCAIIAFRNERRYLPTLLGHLNNQGVDAFLIDNGSDDGSADIVAEYRNAPVIGLTRVPYAGVLDLTALLHAKEQVMGELKHDWLIHHDADEILESAAADQTLGGLAATADRSGVDVIDFDEFVFVPPSPAGYPDGDYRGHGADYYFFQPRPLRLNRMFRRSAFIGFGLSGGHSPTFQSGAVVQASHILRHYIVLDETHARSKYVQRRFAQAGLDKGWHGNRINVPAEAMDLPRALGGTTRLENPASRRFDRSQAKTTHFWEW